MAVSHTLKWKRQASACLFLLGAALSALTYSVPVAAQITTGASTPGEAPADDGEILVVADSGSETRLSADSLRDAARAFARYRATYAPQASLYFRILDGAPDLALYLERQQRDATGTRPRLDLDIDGERRFILPIATILDGHDWVLKSRATRAPVRIRPLTLSPGSTMEDRRFGDLRLHCRVGLAFIRLALPLRALVGAVGPCSSNRIQLFMATQRPLADATLEGYNQPLTIKPDRMSVAIPVADTSISDEARFRIRFQ